MAACRRGEPGTDLLAMPRLFPCLHFSCPQNPFPQCSSCRTQPHCCSERRNLCLLALKTIAPVPLYSGPPMVLLLLLLFIICITVVPKNHKHGPGPHCGRPGTNRMKRWSLYQLSEAFTWTGQFSSGIGDRGHRCNSLSIYGGFYLLWV